MTALEEAESKLTKSISLLTTMQAANKGAELMQERPSPDDMSALAEVIKEELASAVDWIGIARDS